MADNDSAAGSDSPAANEGDTSNGEDAPKYVTLEQHSEMVNKAITDRFKRFEGTLGKRDEALMGQIKELLKPASPDEDDDEEDDDEPDPKQQAKDQLQQGQGESNAEYEKRVRRLERQLKKERERVTELENTNKREREQRLEAKRQQTMHSALSDAGIASSLLKHAAKYVGDRIRYDDDGDLRYFDPDSGEDFSIREGLSQWAKSDDAKPYMPPTGTSGSGDRKRAGGPAGDSKDPRSAVRAAIAAGLRNRG